MGLPVGLAGMVNTLRSDVDDIHADVKHQLEEAARLRVADDRTVHELFDRLKTKLSARFLDWFASGQFADVIEALNQAPKSAKLKASGVAFPEPPTKT